MRSVFAFIAGATLAGLIMSYVMRPKPCTCPELVCGGEVHVVPPPPPRKGTPPGWVFL